MPIHPLFKVANFVELACLGKQVQVYPNLVSDITPFKSEISVGVELYLIDGRKVKFINKAGAIAVGDLAEGTYI